MRNFLWLTCVLFLGLATRVHARAFPEPEVASYQSFDFPPSVEQVTIPQPCQIVLILKPCQRDARLEIGLEREFWALVQRSDSQAMQGWIQKTLIYSQLSHSPYQDRLTMLASFGEVMIFRSYPLSNPIGLTHASKAIGLIEGSQILSADVPSSISMQHYLRAFILYGTQLEQKADQQLETLISMPDIFGDYGSEGVLVGAFGLMSLVNRQKVQKGLDILDDCQNPHCRRTTSLAPYKMVGNAIAMAEAEAYLGHEAKARQIIDRAVLWAQERFYPTVLLNRLSQLTQELFDPENGLTIEWQKEASLGAIRLPLGPSQSQFSCASCHAGNRVPDYYYSWR